MASYTLGPLRLDTEHNLLLREGAPVPLGRRAVALLQALIERPGALVSKDTLIEAAWSGRHVEESNLPVQIAALRRVLGETPGGDRWIETMPGRGYRFIGPIVTEMEQGAMGAPQAATAWELALTPGADAERRQITAMSCELIGISGGADGVGLEDLRDMVAAFQRCVSETVDRHDGFVVSRLGNAALVLFGYPAAHEHDAERAVHAGLELCAALRSQRPDAEPPRRCRVGIATGMAIIGDLSGDGALQDREVIGDAPSLARRLLLSTQPDLVAIEPTTRRLIGNLFDCRDLGTIDTASGTEPVHIWQVLEGNAMANRFEALRGSTLTALVGRDEEIDLLLRRWGRARAGDGQVVMISGEPGIGKSRLVQTLLERIAEEPHTRLRCFCSPHHQDSALYPTIAQLERLAGFRRDDTAEQRLDKLELLLAEATDSPSEAAPLIAGLLSIPTADRYPPLELAPEKRKERTLRALLGQLEGLAARQPVLMLFEDAHWSDPTSIELLDQIVDQTASLRLLLIVTFRPEFVAPGTGRSHVRLLSLNRLPRREQGAIIAGVTGGKSLPQEIAEQIIDRTDGVPLFVEELTKAVVESGMLTDHGDRYVAAGPLPSLAIPATLHGSLLARLDRPAPVRDVAQIGAALGRKFSHKLISAVASMPQPQLDGALARLVGAELVYRRGVPPDAEYTFKHTLIQDAAYQSMLKSRRVDLHARIAEVLEHSFPELAEAEPETLARHLAAGALTQRAIPYWLAAGRRAYERWALREAIVQLNAGIGLLAELRDETARMELELDLEHALALAYGQAKGFAAPEVEAALSRAHELCLRTGKTAKLGPVVSGLARFHWFCGNLSAAKALISQLLDNPDTTSDDEQLMVTHGLMGALLGETGERFESEVHLAIHDRLCTPQRQLSAALRFGVDGVSFCRVFHAINLAHLGHVDTALAAARDAVTLARQVRYSVTGLLVLSAYCSTILRDPAGAGPIAEEAMARATDRGFAFWEWRARAILGWASALQAGARAGVSEIQEAIAAMRSMGVERMATEMLGLLSEAELVTGDTNAAAEAANEALRWGERNTLYTMDGWLLCSRGDAMVALGDRAQAEADYDRALACSRGRNEKWGELNAALRLGRLWQEDRRAGDARDLLASVYGWFTEGFDNPVLRDAKVLLDQLTGAFDPAAISDRAHAGNRCER